MRIDGQNINGLYWGKMAYNENPIYVGSFFALLRSLVFNSLRRLKIKARVFFLFFKIKWNPIFISY